MRDLVLLAPESGQLAVGMDRPNRRAWFDLAPQAFAAENFLPSTMPVFPLMGNRHPIGEARTMRVDARPAPIIGASSVRDFCEGIEDDLERHLRLFPVLKERERQAGGTLSGGEQQMLAIGRALMGRPKLLMVDEPSLGLAPIIVRRIFELLAEIHAQETTILPGGAERQPSPSPGRPRVRALDRPDRAGGLGRVVLGTTGCARRTWDSGGRRRVARD